MSFDRDLRERLVRSASAVEERPVETVFRGIVTSARRRRRIRRATAAGIVIAVGLGAAILGPRALDALRTTDHTTPALPHGVGRIATLAGDGTATTSGDGGTATDAAIRYPVDVAFDAEGNLYVLQNFPATVRKIDPSGTITTVYGSGALGEAGRDVRGPSLSATGLAVDGSGNVYVASVDTDTVIRVAPTGEVTTVAGTGGVAWSEHAGAGFSGDGGPATEAALRTIWDVALDAEGNLYISGNNRIRKVDTSGVITTIAGNGRAGFSGDGGPAVDAQLNGPTGIVVDASGLVYLLDVRNDRVRRIDQQGIITTIAGPGPGPSGACLASGDGGPAIEARLCAPEHLAIDASGNIYVADTLSNRIRKIDVNGIITTVAGTGAHAFSGDGGPALKAGLSEPSSVAVGPDGAIYIADSGNHRIRKVEL